MNIFEGSRRIAKITAALWSVGCVLFALNNSPSVSATYEISNFGNTPKLVTTCPEDAASEHAYSWQHSTEKGTGVSLTLCFLAVDGFTGPKTTKLIPYKIDQATNKVWGNEKYSSDVTSYTKKTLESFKIPEADFPKFDAEHRALWWKEFFTTMGLMFGGLLGFFGFTWAVGYVVRGFMGIPMKADSRNKE